MKIAFIVSGFPKLTETFILNQITELLDMRHDVEIFAKFNPKERKEQPDVEKYHLKERVHYFNISQNKITRILKAISLLIINFHKSPIKILKSLNIFKYGREALSLRLLYLIILFLDKEFDIIHCHFGFNGIRGAYLKEIGIPGKYVTSFHGYDVNSYPKIVGENVYNNLFKKGDLFTTNTRFTKQQVVKLGCNEKKIVIIPVGLRIERFKFFTRKTQPGEFIKILTVGRLVEKKGHEYALRAIAKILTKYKNLIYIIAGDGPLRNKLESLVLELGIKNYVKFLGIVVQEEVLKLYQQAHIFVLSSVTASNEDREGQALVLQEAQAMGLPIISTLHNGIPEGVLDGKSGFLVSEKDVNALADRLDYLIEHPEIWLEMGRCGRNFVKEKYDIKRLNQRLVEIYESLQPDKMNKLKSLKGLHKKLVF